MTFNGGMVSSESDLWATPQALFDKLNAEFHFGLDVCALPETAKCPRYFTPEHDGLAQCWAAETCYLNPPYSEIARWITKAWESAFFEGATVVCLIPARTDTRWWHTYIWESKKHKPRAGVEVRFLKGRVQFELPGKGSNSAPFPSVVVVFRFRGGEA